MCVRLCSHTLAVPELLALAQGGSGLVDLALGGVDTASELLDVSPALQQHGLVLPQDAVQLAPLLLFEVLKRLLLRWWRPWGTGGREGKNKKWA